MWNFFEIDQTKDSFIKLLQESKSSDTTLENIIKLVEFQSSLNASESFKEASYLIYHFIDDFYKLNNMKINLYNKTKDLNTLLFSHGKDFYLDDENIAFFVVPVNDYLNCVIGLEFSSKTIHDEYKEDYTFSESIEFMIKPSVKSLILNEEFSKYSIKDSTTGLFNSNYLNKFSDDFDNEPVALLYIGIDRLKAVVDEFNYEIANQVVVSLSKVLYDLTNDDNTIFRLTEDEFLIMIQNYGTESSVAKTAEQIVDRFSEVEIVVNMFTGQTLKKTICVGISFHSKDQNINVVEAIKKASTALDEAKNRGRNQIIEFTEEAEHSIELF
jgi:two-component system cell cycle response regulator